MNIKIKKLNENAVIPKKAHATDACFDIVATSKVYDKYGNVSYGTGLAFEIPNGYVGLLFPRSSNCKQDLLLCNSVGILDSGYRGEVFFKFKPTVVCWDNDPIEFFEGLDIDERGVDGSTFDYIDFPVSRYSDYNVGDKIGQMLILPYPEIEFNEVSELSDSDRGLGGFGSSGK